MTEPKNIRLIDFTSGVQTVDRLDYPMNAIRDGQNVDISKRIRTRGGISTVDSVGLPSGSEIMALQQVKFPTNEKTYLVAQVKAPIYDPLSYTPGTASSTFVPAITNVGTKYTSTGSGHYPLYMAGWDYYWTFELRFDYIKMWLDSTLVLDIDFSTSPMTEASDRGRGDYYWNSVTPIGSPWIADDQMIVTPSLGVPYRYYAYAPNTKTDGYPTDWTTLLYTCEEIRVDFSYTKTAIDATLPSTFPETPLSELDPYNDFSYQPLIHASSNEYVINIAMTQTEDCVMFNGDGFCPDWTALPKYSSEAGDSHEISVVLLNREGET